MKIDLLLLFSFLSLIVYCGAEADCVTDAYPPPHGRALPVVQIDLDVPASLRWKTVFQQYKNEIQSLLQLLPDVFGRFAPEVLKIIQQTFGPLLDRFPKEFSDEIGSLARFADISSADAVLYNVFYELFTMCTSIVAQDDQNNVIHGRNLDFGIFPAFETNTTDPDGGIQWEMTELLRPLLVTVEFQRDGRLLYRSVHFVGYVGVLSAMGEQFSVTVDDRFDADFDSGLKAWMKNKNDPAQFFGMFLRQLFEAPSPGYDWTQAVSQMNSTQLISPIYFITSGPQPGQGAVITREKDISLDVWQLNQELNDGSFYVVETNYDHWVPSKWDFRRHAAKKCLNQTTQKNINFETMYNVLYTKPVRNKLTTYTILMDVQHGRFESYYQFCDSPCPPW
mmetsp:Transcript_8137/g.12367  ORF Transcript_8137/g.12367 Transcript_8137/m.12367 type:complete len:393 (+) Transcript_8137:45-1223(+)